MFQLTDFCYDRAVVSRIVHCCFATNGGEDIFFFFFTASSSSISVFFLILENQKQAVGDYHQLLTASCPTTHLLLKNVPQYRCQFITHETQSHRVFMLRAIFEAAVTTLISPRGLIKSSMYRSTLKPG